MSPEEIQAALSAILAQPVRQSKLLADWVRDCLPTTLILGAAVSAGISFVILIQPGPRLALFVGALIALLPPLILLRWILAIPRICRFRKDRWRSCFSSACRYSSWLVMRWAAGC